MNRLAVYALAAGMILIVGSCVPVAQSLWRSAAMPADEVFEMPPGTNALTVTEIGAREALVVALEVIVPLPDAAVDPTWSVAYSVSLADAGGRILHNHAGALGPEVQDVLVSRSDSKLRLHTRLPLMKIAAVTALHLRVDMSDGGDTSLSRSVRLFYDPPSFVIGFFATLLIWVLGLLLVLTGVIQSVRNLAAVPVAPGPDDRHGRLWGIACHLLALTGYLLPMGHMLAPLLVWRAKRDRHRQVEIEGRESLNFQISVTVYALVAVLLSFVFVGLVMLAAIVAFHFSMTLFAALRVQRGQPARYPLTMRIIPAPAPFSQ